MSYQSSIPVIETNANHDKPEIRYQAVLAYVPLLGFIPLFTKKDDPFVLFHAKQGLVLFILGLSAMALDFVPLLGDVLSTLAFVMCGMFSVMGAMKSVLGESWEMPVIYELSQKIDL